MLIGVDSRSLEGNRTGVGRYLLNLLKIWSTDHCLPSSARFILYFKDKIPSDLPAADFFEFKLLNVRSNAKFVHWNLPRAARKDKIDILFCPAYVAPFCYKGKIALTLHDISYEARPKEFNWPSLADRILLKWVSRRSAKKAAVIFASSEFSRQEVIKYYGLPPAKVITTLLAADPSLFNAINNGTVAIKEKYGLEDKFIFYVGSIFTRRHLPEIISAFERLARADENYQLLLAGKDSTEGQAVNKLAEKINQEFGRKAVLRVDFVSDEDLKLLYGACAFFIWLSDYEGFGFPPLEAMSLGAPVITTGGSSLKEVAGEAGMFIKENTDVEEIYRAMHKLARDSAWREELSIRGKEQAVKFSWKECAKITLEVLIKI